MLWIIAFLIAAGILMYHRVKPLVSTVLLAAVLAAWQGVAQPHAAASIIVWSLFITAALILNVTALRRGLMSDRILPMLRRALPAMSQTEREALEAGTVGWDAELFRGRPDWETFFKTPAASLTPDERAFIEGPVETLCRMLDDWNITHQQGDLPPEVWHYIKDQRFFGMIIPKEYGGLGFSALAHSCVVMKVATRSITAAVTVMVPNSLGPAELLLHYGTRQQREHYLPRLARGEEVPCFALTGPEAGSDASSLPDRGVVCRGAFEGREVVGIKLDWEKRYITLGPVATLLGLAFKLHDPEHLLGDKEELGITLALIPTHTPGVSIGRRHFPLNMAFQNGPNWGEDVFIPLDWVIGGRDGVGQGWRMLMESLAAGRSISLPALATGAGKLVCRATGAYARVRRQFKTAIGKFEGVEEALARMAGYTYVMDAARILTLGYVDRGERPSVISAIVKYHLTERMRTVVNDAMDVQGGSAICMGPRNYLARVYQAIPISITVEGANILTRSLIIFGQGAVRCHPYILKEMEAALSKDGPAFDRALFGHMGYLASNFTRALWLAVTRAHGARVPLRGVARRYVQELDRLSAAFALVADAAMLSLGGALKRKEKLSARLGDVLSLLYLASAAVKRYEDEGRRAEDVPLLRYGVEDALHKAETALHELLRNLPGRSFAAVLRAVVFPWGRRMAAPDDRVGHRAAALLLAPSPARDRLTAGMHVPGEADEFLARLERALAMTIRAEHAEERLRAAVKHGEIPFAASRAELLREAVRLQIIEPDAAAAVEEAERLRREVVAVDHFAPQELARARCEEVHYVKSA